MAMNRPSGRMGGCGFTVRQPEPVRFTRRDAGRAALEGFALVAAWCGLALVLIAAGG